MADIQAGLERLHSRASRYRTRAGRAPSGTRPAPQVEFANKDAGAVLDRCEREASEASVRLVAASASPRPQSRRSARSARFTAR